MAHLKPIRVVCEGLDPAIWQHIMAQQLVPKKAVEPSFQPRHKRDVPIITDGLQSSMTIWEQGA